MWIWIKYNNLKTYRIYYHRYYSNCYISKGSTTRKNKNTSHPELHITNTSPKKKKVERMKENAQGKRQTILRLYRKTFLQKEKRISQQLNRKTEQRRYWPDLRLAVNIYIWKILPEQHSNTQTRRVNQNLRNCGIDWKKSKSQAITSPVKRRPLWSPFAKHITRNKS